MYARRLVLFAGEGAVYMSFKPMLYYILNFFFKGPAKGLWIALVFCDGLQHSLKKNKNEKSIQGPCGLFVGRRLYQTDYYK